MRKDDYLQMITDHASAIADAALADPDRQVPSCPGWAIRDLAFHVGAVMAMWADVVRRGSLERTPLGDGLEPPTDEAVHDFVMDQARDLVDVLAAADEDAPAWNWWGDPTVRWIPRRVAHEMVIHHWDAANALDAPFDANTDVAADGIAEFFAILLPKSRVPLEGPTASVGLIPTDHRVAWRVVMPEGGKPKLEVSRQPSDATIRASAWRVLLMLWDREQPRPSEIEGNPAVAETLLAYPRRS